MKFDVLLWVIIDRIITSPAWIAGYMYEAVKLAFFRGKESYQVNFNRSVK